MGESQAFEYSENQSLLHNAIKPEPKPSSTEFLLMKVQKESEDFFEKEPKKLSTCRFYF